MQILEFTAYWLLLGFLSSAGLGSGLHTFLFYLGPHIVRVTNHAVQCGNTDFSAEMSSYWAVNPTYADDAWTCEKNLLGDGGVAHVSVIDIVQKVAPAAFLWGVGTSIGELPPYFFARTAARSGKRIAEVQELSSAASHGAPKQASYITRCVEGAKGFVFSHIKAWGFWGILLAASVPNPAFDAAGIACGHFGVPFWEFFGATMIGKACIKVMLQVVFTAFVFNPASILAFRAAVTAGIDAFEDAVFGSQFKACWAPLKQAYVGGGAGHSAVAAGGAVAVPQPDGASVALPLADLVGCKTCCADTFAGVQLAQEKCVAGCTEFVHGPGWLSAVWGYIMFAVVGMFLLSALQALVQDELLEQQQDARAAAKASAKQGELASTESGASRSRSRSRTRSTDVAFVPDADEAEAAEDISAPAVGRLVSTRTRSSSRGARKRA